MAVHVGYNVAFGSTDESVREKETLIACVLRLHLAGHDR